MYVCLYSSYLSHEKDEEVKAETDGSNSSAPPCLKRPKLKDNTPTKILNHHTHEVPHMGTLELTVTRARSVRKVGFMGTGLPDTYVKVRIEKHRYKTKLIKNETDPVYDDVFEMLIDDASEAILDFSIKDTEYGGLSSREMGNAKVALSKLLNGLKCSGVHEIELTDRKGKRVCMLEYSIAWRGLRSRASIVKHKEKKKDK